LQKKSRPFVLGGSFDFFFIRLQSYLFHRQPNVKTALKSENQNKNNNGNSDGESHQNLPLYKF